MANLKNNLNLMDGVTDDGAAEMEGKYLTFWLKQQLYGIPISDVVQIVGMQEITPIPEFPHYAKGIINLRGSIIPLIDVRLRFGMEEAAYNEHTCTIVTNIQDLYIGMIVDSVDEVTDIADDEIAAPPARAGGMGDTYLTGLGKKGERVILLLNTQKILSGDQLGLLQSGY